MSCVEQQASSNSKQERESLRESKDPPLSIFSRAPTAHSHSQPTDHRLIASLLLSSVSHTNSWYPLKLLLRSPFPPFFYRRKLENRGRRLIVFIYCDALLGPFPAKMRVLCRRLAFCFTWL